MPKFKMFSLCRTFQWRLLLRWSCGQTDKFNSQMLIRVLDQRSKSFAIGGASVQRRHLDPFWNTAMTVVFDAIIALIFQQKTRKSILRYFPITNIVTRQKIKSEMGMLNQFHHCMLCSTLIDCLICS